MSKEKRIKRELYDPKIHGDFTQYSFGKPEKKGYYRVQYLVRNTYYVSVFYWDGWNWFTPRKEVARTMVRHIPESWRPKR